MIHSSLSEFVVGHNEFSNIWNLKLLFYHYILKCSSCKTNETKCYDSLAKDAVKHDNQHT